ncbi:hypothetical protein DUNSADRAFT_12250, partial [Dunaliella salina]
PQIADMPDEAAEIELEKAKGKGKRKLGPAADDQPSKPGDEGRSESSAGDGGTENDAQSAVSGSSAHDEILIDFRRGRLLKKLVKQVRGPSLMEPLERLNFGTLKVLAGVLIVHIVCFAVLISEITDEEGSITDIMRHARAIQENETMRFRIAQARFCTEMVRDGEQIPEENVCELGTQPERLAGLMLDAMPTLCFMCCRSLVPG